MAYDANVVLQESVTKTNTFNGTGVDIKGTPTTGMWARILVSSASNTSGSETVTFTVDHSDSSGSGYTVLASGADQVITTTSTATPYEIFIPVNTSKRYIRVTATFSATTGTPTATYSADLGLVRP